MPRPIDQDPYQLLGLARDARADEVHRAYRRAARASHPDHLPGDPEASVRFVDITAAYETLRDPQRRKSYDRAHPLVTHPPPSMISALLRTVDPPSFRPANATGPRRKPALWAGPVHITAPGRK